MNRSRNQNSLLVEIMIAVLFFALCSTVILEVFVMARDYSHIAGIDTEVMNQMQNIAERMYVEADAEALLAENGYVQKDGAWIKTTLCAEEKHEFLLKVTIADEPTEVGHLRVATIQAVRGGEVVAEIPSVRYESSEVGQ